jgi:nitrile hydratase beta subunit
MTYQSNADFGGQLSYGRIIPEPEGELFHASWEPQAFALTLAMGATGAWNIDMSRSARETLPEYRALSYYQSWIRGLEKLLMERGLVAAEEIAAARMLYPPRSVPRVLRAADVTVSLAKGSPTQRTTAAPARFETGDRVRTRSAGVDHHTRLPGYARGRVGRIERIHGPHIFPDAHAQGQGEQPQWLYTVAFTGRELWGSEANEALIVSIDAWEPYLEPAE